MNKNPNDGKWQDEIRKFIAYAIAVIGIVSVVLIIGLIAYRDISDGAWYAIAKEHFAAVIGLPFAAIGSFILVRAFEHESEKISFKAIGIEFNATSGAILLWVVVFLAITVSIKLLW